MRNALGLLVALASVAAAAEPAAPQGQRPLYYEQPMQRKDLRDRSAEELRLMRNTIYARAGREFKDPDLRAYFGKQPWYRPSARPPAKLNAADEANLAAIRKWEPAAKAVADLRRLVPRWGKADDVPRPPDCGADAQGVLRDKKHASRLVALAARLSWSSIDGGDNIPWDDVNMKKPEVRIACLPDIDEDGAPEAIATIDRHYRGEFKDDSIAVVFLVSGTSPDWRAVAPLGLGGTFPGIEGSHATSVRAVRLANGTLALAIETSIGAGGDECCEDNVTVSIVTLKKAKLTAVKSFDINDPCECP